MFYNNFVVSIRSNGKFFREREDSIRIPFGSEYSIYLKNLESRKAVVKVSIDGKDVLSGNRLIVYGNSALDLEGYLSGTMAKNKFKFIEMTDAIEKHRGVNPEDGLIRIEFQFEKEQECKPEYYYHYYAPNWWTFIPANREEYGTFSSQGYDWNFINSNSITYNTGGKGSSAFCGYSDVSSQNQFQSFSDNNCGITVPGNDVYQQFYAGYTRELENKVAVMTFKLYGYNPDEEKNVSFVSDRIECQTCGKKSKSFQNFCDQCGTKLK